MEVCNYSITSYMAEDEQRLCGNSVEHDVHSQITAIPCRGRHVHTDCHPAEETLVPVVDPGFDGNRTLGNPPRRKVASARAVSSLERMRLLRLACAPRVIGPRINIFGA